MIIGAGISGCTAGYELAEMGHDVEIIESGSEIGGKVLTYCCKATEECSRCGVCVAHTKLNQALKHERIHLSVGAKIQSVAEKEEQISIEITPLNPSIDHKKCIDCRACVQACPESCISRFQRAELVQYTIDYSRCLIQKGKVCTACMDACLDACPTGAISCGKGSKEEKKKIIADGVLIATGHDPFDAVQKVRYGYARLNNIITGAEAEEILSKQSYLGDPEDSIAFIQCVGSRDPQIGRNYCSAVCCSYALRLARIINHRSPEADVTIYYIDIQNFDKTFTVLREELRKNSNIHFVRGVPFSVEQLANGKLKLLIESVNGEDSVALHDKVVLSVGLGPASGSERIAELFKIEQDEFGFFREHENVFVCGTCKEPQSIPESMASARAAAVEMNKSRNPGPVYGVNRKEQQKNIKQAAAETNRGISASSLIPAFEMKTLPLELSVLVVGGGPAGLYTTVETRLLGYKTIVIEKSGKTGGRCSADDLPGFDGTVYTKSVMTELKGHIGSFTAKINTPSGEKEIHCGAIVIASGSHHGNNGKTEVFNNSSIIHLSQLKKACAALPRLKKIRSIGIILDLDIDETKASTEAALLIAKELQERERVQVYLFCRDMRVAALNLEKLYNETRDEGVNIVKYEGKLQLSAGAGAETGAVAGIERGAGAEKGAETGAVAGIERGAGNESGAEAGIEKPNPVELSYRDSVLQQDASAACDLVGISACGISSAADPALAELTAISTDLLGQLQDNNIHLFPEQTNRPGIFVVGACRGQYYLPQIAAEAKTTALAVHSLLKDGSMEVELSNAVVDEDKCILCLTCVRSCPYHAMEVDREKGAAVSIPEVCQKCGICAGECPAKAIQLPVYSDDVLLSLI